MTFSLSSILFIAASTCIVGVVSGDTILLTGSDLNGISSYDDAAQLCESKSATPFLAPPKEYCDYATSNPDIQYGWAPVSNGTLIDVASECGVPGRLDIITMSNAISTGGKSRNRPRNLQEGQTIGSVLCTTTTPTGAPSSKSGTPSGTKGDPHFIMFNGKHFDFHGGCDLVLVDAPNFNNGQGLKIHIRTKVKSWFSYVESAVVQIGKDRLEVRGGFTKRKFWHNGHVLPGRRLTKVNGPLPIKVGGFEVTFQTQIDFISWRVAIHLPNDQTVTLRTIKDYMRIDIEQPKAEYFASAKGLMGSFQEGEMLGRDGAIIFEDANAFAMEWQVQDEQLFHAVDGPQYPQQCTMPAAQTRTTKRLLAESSITYEMAEKACAHLMPEERDDCIYDVIATSDMDIAGAY